MVISSGEREMGFGESSSVGNGGEDLMGFLHLRGGVL